MAKILKKEKYEDKYTLKITPYPQKEILNYIYNSKEKVLENEMDMILKNGYYCAGLCDAFDIDYMEIEHNGETINLNRGVAPPGMTMKELLYELAELGNYKIDLNNSSVG